LEELFEEELEFEFDELLDEEFEFELLDEFELELLEELELEFDDEFEFEFDDEFELELDELLPATVIVPSLRLAWMVEVRSTSGVAAGCSFACAEAPATAATPAIRADISFPYLVMMCSCVTGPGFGPQGERAAPPNIPGEFGPAAGRGPIAGIRPRPGR
jgi:hypothetical protein